MVTLEQLIEDGYIFIGNKEEKGLDKIVSPLDNLTKTGEL